MVRMASLPDDALRCVCAFLAPRRGVHVDPEWDFRRDQALAFNDNWKAMNLLEFIQRTAHAIYEEYYSDDLDFANY